MGTGQWALGRGVFLQVPGGHPAGPVPEAGSGMVPQGFRQPRAPWGHAANKLSLRALRAAGG